MKPETILSAMEDAKEESDFCFQVRDVGRGYGKYHSLHRRRLRQYNAFRIRILRMYADREYKIALLVEDKWNLVDETRQLKQRIAMLDEHIAKLNGMLERLGVDMVTMELSDE